MRPVAADAVIVRNGSILLVKRLRDPFKGMLALPGGFLKDDETLERCVVREVREECGLTVKPVRLLGVYSNPRRDPRGTVSVSYLCKIVGGREKAGSDASAVAWYPLSGLKSLKLAFDHKKIVRDAIGAEYE